MEREHTGQAPMPACKIRSFSWEHQTLRAVQQAIHRCPLQVLTITKVLLRLLQQRSPTTHNSTARLNRNTHSSLPRRRRTPIMQAINHMYPQHISLLIPAIRPIMVVKIPRAINLRHTLNTIISLHRHLHGILTNVIVIVPRLKLGHLLYRIMQAIKNILTVMRRFRLSPTLLPPLGTITHPRPPLPPPSHLTEMHFHPISFRPRRSIPAIGTLFLKQTSRLPVIHPGQANLPPQDSLQTEVSVIVLL